MAKFANLTYGTNEDTKEYTYVVNDNVRVGDTLQPAVRHYISGKVFGTTGIVMSTTKTTTAKAKENISKISDEKTYSGTGETKKTVIAEVLTGKQAGIKPLTARGQGGRFEKVYGEKGVGVAEAPTIGKVRDANVERYNQGKPVKEIKEEETFDSYSEKFREKE